MDSWQAIPTVEPPRGMYPSRLDQNGRIKLPVGFQRYIGSIREKPLFVTSLDRRVAQIYPMATWRQNEAFFESYREDPEAAEKVAFNANDLGAEAEMDSQGRISFSPELRQALGIENQPVKIFAYKGRIEVLSEAVYEERKAAAAEGAPQAVRKLEGAGLK